MKGNYTMPLENDTLGDEIYANFLGLGSFQLQIDRITQRILSLVKDSKSGIISIIKMEDEVASHTERLQMFKGRIQDTRQEVCKKIKELPVLKNDARFADITDKDISKMEKFYESVMYETYDMERSVRIDFEHAMESAIQNYDNITELYGGAWHESFTNAQKLSSIFVNNALKEMKVHDCRTGDEITIDQDNLEICSYSASDADVICDAMTGSTSLEKFHALITVNMDAISEVHQAVRQAVAEEPFFGSFLSREKVADITSDLISKLDGLDGGLASEVQDFIYERVAVVATSYGNRELSIRSDAQDMFIKLRLPVLSDRQQSYVLDGEKYWITEDGTYTESQMQDRYDTQIKNMEAEIPFFL